MFSITLLTVIYSAVKITEFSASIDREAKLNWQCESNVRKKQWFALDSFLGGVVGA